MSKWFFLVDGRAAGPVEPYELKRLADVGQLRPTDKVRRADMANWCEAKQLKGLFTSVHTCTPTQLHDERLNASPDDMYAASLALTKSPPIPHESATGQKNVLFNSLVILLGVCGCTVMLLVVSTMVAMNRQWPTSVAAGATSQNRPKDTGAASSRSADASGHVESPGHADISTMSPNTSPERDIEGQSEVEKFRQRSRAVYSQFRDSQTANDTAETSENSEETYSHFTGLEDGVSRAPRVYHEALNFLRLYAAARVAGQQEPFEQFVQGMSAFPEAEVQQSIERGDANDLVGRAGMSFTLATMLESAPSLIESDYFDTVNKVEPQYREAFVVEYRHVRLDIARRLTENGMKTLNKAVAAGLRVN